MSNGFLSQEEIDSLLNGGADESSEAQPENVVEDTLTDLDKDLLGEIGNITMGSASTALSTILNQKVNITTPVVNVTTVKELKESFEVPNVALEVKYTSGIVGENLLVMKIVDAAVVANLMMGGNGIIDKEMSELSEIEISAVAEAMNQMIGASATSMATMFNRAINISPPDWQVLTEQSQGLTEELKDNDIIVKVSFHLTIGELVDSNIMQVLPMETAKKIVNIMMGNEVEESQEVNEIPTSNSTYESENSYSSSSNGGYDTNMVYEKPAQSEASRVEVNKASFQPLQTSSSSSASGTNIDLIMDVPLEVSVVLGRTKKSIGDILKLGTGSLIELDKLVEEPVEILVNGKKVAYGEVVVVDGNFGVRITSIVNHAERIKSLG